MTVTVSVKLLDEEYQVSCGEEEVDDLAASARDMDRRMREIRESGKVFGVERIAVMAGLNIAHDNVVAQHRLAAIERDVQRLAGRVNRALEDAGDGSAGASQPAKGSQSP